MIACHFLAVGPKANLDALVASENWPTGIECLELLESSPRRRLWQFETPRILADFLRRTSHRHPQLSLVLDYDTGRIRGLMRWRNGQKRCCQLRYQP